MKKQKFNVFGMTCSACSANVTAVVSKLNGVKNAQVNLLAKELVAEYDENLVKDEDIISAVTKIGYKAFLQDETGSAGGKNNFKQKWDIRKQESERETKELKTRFYYSIGFLMVLMYVSMGSMMGLPLPSIISQSENPMLWAFTQFLLSLPIIILNRKFFVVGFKALYHLKPNMDSLVGIGSGASLIYGIFALYRMMYALTFGDTETLHHYSHQLYFESAAMILALVTLGKYLEAKSKGKTGEALEKLIDLAPKTARILENGEEKIINAEDIKKGDIIVIRPGESIPADGKIIEGRGFLDESSITGESLPVEKAEGDEVITATVNKNGSFNMMADRVGDDTTLAQIVKLVDEAGNSKAPIARLADEVSLWFVPAVIGISIVTLLVWLFIGEGFEFAFSSAVSVLVISCPCALGLATPVAIMVGTGKAAELGILVKSAQSLETLSKIDTVILDKTGTITEGAPVVTDIMPMKAGLSQEEFLRLAYAVENKSEHPLAQAVVVKAKEENIPLTDTEEFLVIPGKGARAKILGKDYVTGSLKLFKEILGDKNTAVLEEKIEEVAKMGKTPLIFAEGQEILGIIAVADTLKPTSTYAIKLLKDMGRDVIMLTGDNKITAAAIGKEVGIDHIMSEVLPSDKEKCVREEQEKGHKVVMVGDGINDSPALTRADVGIAVGKGTDIAIESADVVLMKDSLFDIVTSLNLSTAVIKNIKMNLFWALFYNVLCIPLAAGILYYPFGLHLNPMFGALAMSLSSVCVVTNALRLRFFKDDSGREFKDKLLAEEAAKREAKKEAEKENKTEEFKMKKTVSIEGMMCMHCVSHVDTALKGLENVKDVKVSLENKNAEIFSDVEIPNEKIESAVKNAGYEVTSIS